MPVKVCPRGTMHPLRQSHSAVVECHARGDMPGCCHLTRRQFLQWGALVAPTPLLSGLSDVERAYGLPRAADPGPAVPMNLELVPLTETPAIVTWFTGDPTRPDAVG